jgi:tRNA-Thr(GGU) m(6)t(6)A37 methyltransferase TsaA
MSEFSFKAIGVVHSPFKEPKNVPIQAAASKGTEGTIEVYPQYAEGLTDLDGFSHIILLYHLHLVRGSSLMVKPFLDDKLRGVFATRAPARPNRIGFSVVRLERIEGNVVHIRDLDVVEGTPVLDIKPYIPAFDCVKAEKIGWFTDKIDKLDAALDDGRFCK